MAEQQYGGPWSEQKLKVLRDYLVPYLRIFRRNESAKFLSPIYVDAFSGCGTRTPRGDLEVTLGLFETDEDRAEASDFATSSPRVALELVDVFDRYLFIDSNSAYTDQLRSLIQDSYPTRAPLCEIRTADANDFIPRWCSGLKRNERAVMFLDPYGTEVHWNTIKAIAETQKVDLWMLLPCSGVLRMLPHTSPPNEAWTTRLNELLGTTTWQSEWYQAVEQSDLFGAPEAVSRNLTPIQLAAWITNRLEQIFVQTVEKPLFLYNQRNSPLFMLMFAAGNPAGATIACRIANDIIKRQLEIR